MTNEAVVTVVHDYTEASIPEGGKDSVKYFIVISVI